MAPNISHLLNGPLESPCWPETDPSRANEVRSGSQSVLFSCSLPPSCSDLISPAGVSFRPAKAF